MTALRCMQGDITTLEVDAIVNAANSALMGGGGVDGAIHRAGGPSILAECRDVVARQGGCEPGDAVATGAGDMRAKWVIHTVGPVFNGRNATEHDRTLARAYENSLVVAMEIGARTVAFPNISTGVYRFPKARAARVALEAVRASLAAENRLNEVIFVCHDDENFAFYEAQI